MKQKIMLSIVLCIVFLVGCHVSGRQVDTSNKDNATPKQLIVYVSGVPHEFQVLEEPDNEDNCTLYPSKHIIGMRMVGGELNCEGGNVFAQALRDYSQQTGIDIEIHYLEEYNGQSEIMQDLYEQNKLPDLMIVNKHSMYDYYRFDMLPSR